MLKLFGEGGSNMLFDSHAHYDDKAFDNDRESILTSLKKANVGTIVNVSSSLSSVKSTIELAEKYSFLYGAVGVHPNEVGELNQENFEWLRQQCLHQKVVAVGEIGLDYYWDKQNCDLQKKWFIAQLEMAKEFQMPVIIHSREAAFDTLEILRQYATKIKAVIHCYSYSVEIAQEYLKMGYYLGVGGVLTFKNSRKLKETVCKAPLDRLLLETDCPYLAPVPNRGKRNDSRNLIFIADEIAKIKELSTEEAILITEENAKCFYHIIT